MHELNVLPVKRFGIEMILQVKFQFPLISLTFAHLTV